MRILVVLVALIALCTQSLRAQEGDAVVHARRDVVLTADCSRIRMRPPEQAEEGIRVCREAVEAANQLPSTAVRERSTAHGYLGDALLLARQWRDAIDEYDLALSIDPASGGIHAAELKGLTAVAYLNLGELGEADRVAGSAVENVEASLSANPGERRMYVMTLRTLLSVHARVKQLQGDLAAVERLTEKAAALDSSK